MDRNSTIREVTTILSPSFQIRRSESLSFCVARAKV